MNTNHPATSDHPLPDAPQAWQADDGDDYLHVTGTHDLVTARHHAAMFVRHELELSEAQTTVVVATDPHLWWSLPARYDGPDGDVRFPHVPAATPGAVPMTTWELPADPA